MEPGVILYPKPAGVTSHDVVARVRRDLPKGVKVGHAGTLDPFATGLLLVLVGAATRVQRFLMALPKAYRTVARLGWTSTTGDPEGQLVHTGRVPDLSSLPVGDLMQAPPAYSAVKLGGERLYKKARRGEAVDVPARPVSVYRFDLLASDGERAEFEIECSAGTYIRTLVSDLGDAYCEELVRTAIGPFSLEAADAGHVLPLADALSFLPERTLDAAEAERVGHGVALALNGLQGFQRLTHEGALLAIAEPGPDRLQPVVVFPR